MVHLQIIDRSYCLYTYIYLYALYVRLSWADRVCHFTRENVRKYCTLGWLEEEILLVFFFIISNFQKWCSHKECSESKNLVLPFVCIILLPHESWATLLYNAIYINYNVWTMSRTTLELGRNVQCRCVKVILLNSQRKCATEAAPAHGSRHMHDTHNKLSLIVPWKVQQQPYGTSPRRVKRQKISAFLLLMFNRWVGWFQSLR